MTWQQRKDNLLLAFKDKTTAIIAVIAAVLIILIQILFTDFALLAGNMGATFATIETITGVVLALFFGINIGLLYYKLRLASSVNAKESSGTIIGGIFGVLVTGCPACSITLASYLGLASILSTLPFSGLEIKTAGLILLAYSTSILLKNLTTCTAKPLLA